MTMMVPELKTPTGACDCHMHVIYPESKLPVGPGEMPFPEASMGDYKEVTSRLGIDRCVVTQTPRYGFDNRCVLEAIAEFGSGALGTAAVDGSVGKTELERLSAAGIRGAALHMLAGGRIGWGHVQEIAQNVMAVGWHLHIQLDGAKLADHLPLLVDLPNTLVIDHIGKFSKPGGVDSAGYQALLRLVDTGRCYVKLSAPYESAWGDYPYLDHSGGLAKALVKAAPERMIWASNWPHLGVPNPDDKPSDAALLDTLLHWTDTPSEREMILEENPARLYGFN